MPDSYKEYSGMEIMLHAERESLKRNATNERVRNWSRYHRFLEGTLHKNEPQVYVKGFHPTFRQYLTWMKEHEGWSHCKITRTHPLWIEGTKISDYPMNRFYAEANKRRREIGKANAKKKRLGL